MPQWYDLTAITPEGTIPGALSFILTDLEGETVQVWVSDNGQILNIEGANTLWDLAGLSINDFFTEWENSTGNQYYAIGQKIDKKTHKVIDPGIYVSNYAYNTLYYKVAKNQTIEEKNYLKESFIKQNLYRKDGETYTFIGDNEEIKLNELSIDSSNCPYYIRQNRPKSQIEWNRWEYIPVKNINIEKAYYKINDDYYYSKNPDILYIKQNNNYLKLDSLEYYWKIEDQSMVLKDFSNIEIYDWVFKSSGWTQNTQEKKSFDFFINDSTIYYKAEEKYVEEEDENGIVTIKPKTVYSTISREDATADNCYIKYKDNYLPLKNVEGKQIQWFYKINDNSSFEVIDQHQEYIFYNNEYESLINITDKYIEVEKKSVSSESTLNKEYVLLQDYLNSSTTESYYWVTNENNGYPIETSKLKLKPLYVNNSDSNLSNFEPVYTNTKLDTYYQTTIEREKQYPLYKYYSLTMFLEQDIYDLKLKKVQVLVREIIYK